MKIIHSSIFLSLIIAFSFTFASAYEIPGWVKSNAEWWAADQIDDKTFVSGIEFLVKEGIIQIPQTTQMSSQSSEGIPGWIKNNADWWSQGMISDDDFIKGVQYLVENGIIVTSTDNLTGDNVIDDTSQVTDNFVTFEDPRGIKFTYPDDWHVVLRTGYYAQPGEIEQLNIPEENTDIFVKGLGSLVFSFVYPPELKTMSIDDYIENKKHEQVTLEKFSRNDYQGYRIDQTAIWDDGVKHHYITVEGLEKKFPIKFVMGEQKKCI